MSTRGSRWIAQVAVATAPLAERFELFERWRDVAGGG
jgi:hypothetical protein